MTAASPAPRAVMRAHLVARGTNTENGCLTEGDDAEGALNALMGRLAAGDRTAFEPLFRALHPRARRFARTRLAPASAEDAAQSALMRVFAHASRFEPGRPLLPWFYAIVANEIRTARRQASARGELDSDQDPALEPSYEDALLKRELLGALEPMPIR